MYNVLHNWLNTSYAKHINLRNNSRLNSISMILIIIFANLFLCCCCCSVCLLHNEKTPTIKLNMISHAKWSNNPNAFTQEWFETAIYDSFTVVVENRRERYSTIQQVGLAVVFLRYNSHHTLNYRASLPLEKDSLRFSPHSPPKMVGPSDHEYTAGIRKVTHIRTGCADSDDLRSYRLVELVSLPRE